MLYHFKNQFIFNAFAKLVATHIQPVECSMKNNGTSLFQMAQFLWAFKNEQVLDSISYLEISFPTHTKSIPTFLVQLLQEMKKSQIFCDGST